MIYESKPCDRRDPRGCERGSSTIHGCVKNASQLRGAPMHTDVLTTRVADGIAVITLGSPRRIYFDAEMGDALTEALDQFAGDANIRVVVVTGGAPVILTVISTSVY